MITTKQIPKKIREARKEGEKGEKEGHEREGHFGVSILSRDHRFFVGDNHFHRHCSLATGAARLALRGDRCSVLGFLCRGINC